jgi:hypothetical protein
MTPLDRELFQALTLRQAQLEEALLQLRVEFKELAQRAELAETIPPPIPEKPPLPLVTQLNPISAPPPLPKIPVVEESVVSEVQDTPAVPDFLAPFALIPKAVETEIAPVVETASDLTGSITEIPTTTAPLPALPEAPLHPSAEAAQEDKQGGLEFQFGRWLARIGVVFALITLISFSTLAYKQFHHLMGPWSKLSVLTLISAGLVAAGLRIERRNSELTVYGRTVAGGGLACLYYTLYGATYVTPLQVIHSTLLGGFLLLGWSAYVLYLAEQKKSELLSVFAIALAYFSSAITPVGDFTMVANLILSLTAVVFLIRNAWTGLSYLCLVGTYFGLLRQFVVYDSSSDFWFEVTHAVPFWPAATYLAGTWLIYTAGVFLAQTPHFAAGKRMAFLCLNNGALIGLLITAAYLSEFGHLGPILCIVGGIFLGTSYLAARLRPEAVEINGAYLMQGLALFTGGIAIAYAGVTRGLLITVESVFLAAAGAYSRNLIMQIAAGLSALIGTALLLVEITPEAAHPWVLIIGGAAAMLTNAWLARRQFWSEARDVAAQRFVLSSAYYVLLATGLLGFGIVDSPLSENWTAAVMALIALALTFSVYLVPLFELPLVIQLLLLFAIRGATFPLDDSHALGNELIVGLVTAILIAWYPRQKIVSTTYWLQPMLIVYALAMVAIGTCAVHPLVSAQGWMISASLLSLGFLLYGAFTRTWPLAAAGQIFLGISLNGFFYPSTGTFPWTWWGATVPIAVTFFTAWFVQEWLRKTDDLPAESELRGFLRVFICAYQALTVGMIARLIFGLVPDANIPLCFFGLGTALMLWNLKWPSSMGVRCAIALDLFGTVDYLAQVANFPAQSSTWINALGLAFLLAQPVVLRRWGTALISTWEIHGVTFLSNLSVSLYVYWVLHPHLNAQGWMIAASLISLAYLAYGLWTRMGQFIISGQVYLAVSIWTFLNPPGNDLFPWTWWAAALPPAVVFLTGWLAHRWLPRFLGLSEEVRYWLTTVSYLYQAVALGLAVRWIFGIVPADEDTLVLFILATSLLLWNAYRASAFGVRSALVVSLIGAGSYLFTQFSPIFPGFTWADTFGLALFLGQPAILRRWGRVLITEVESWTVILTSAGVAWIFISHSISLAGSNNMTLGWAIYALAVTVLGFAAKERRQRWCGLVILVAAIIHVGVYDFWGFSDLYKVLTFFALTVICLGLSFIYYKFGDRLKELL